MSKELTEQWRNGELEKGRYYIAIKDRRFVKDWFDGKQFEVFFSNYIVEVLAPVPDYEQFVELTEKANQFSQMEKKVEAKEQEYIDCLRDVRNQLTEQILQHLDEIDVLQKKLNIAVKALGYYAQCKHINLDLVTIREGCAEFEAFENGGHARKALKEMEKV